MSDPTIGARVERAFAEFARTNGWEIHFRGWPDFLVFADGRIFCVEVKSGKATVHPRQGEMISALRRAGIETLIWREGKGFYRPRLRRRRDKDTPLYSSEASGGSR